MNIPDSGRVVRADGTGPQSRSGANADGQPPSGRATAASVSLGHHENEPAVATSEDLPALYRILVDADDRSDVAVLARLGWVLFTMASATQESHREAVGLLGELRTAARAAIAGDGNPASLAPLHHVLAEHGWLPLHDSTPLQMLAAPR
jgi:hypothetical protein